MLNKKFYVTRWKRECLSWQKIKLSLRSFHFDDFDSALKFFEKIDTSVYRANLKSFDVSTGLVELLESL